MAGAGACVGQPRPPGKGLGAVLMKFLGGDDHGGAEPMLLQDPLGELNIFKGIWLDLSSIYRSGFLSTPFSSRYRFMASASEISSPGPWPPERIQAASDWHPGNGRRRPAAASASGRGFPITGGAQDVTVAFFRGGTGRAPQHHHGHHDEPDKQDGDQRHQNDQNNPQPLSLPDILEYAPEKGRPNTGGQAQSAGRGGSDHPNIDDAARQGQQGNKQQEGKKTPRRIPGQAAPTAGGGGGAVQLFDGFGS